MREIPRRKLMLATVIAGCALFVGVPRDAEAQPAGLRAEVQVLHGTTCATPVVDPNIRELPPLRHNCWKILDTKSLPLVQGTPGSMQLANGRTFQLSYNGLTGEKPPRYKVTALINKPDGAGFNQLADVTAEPGKKFHVGGFAYQNGTLVLAIRILP
jgi:hypothetical protein